MPFVYENVNAITTHTHTRFLPKKNQNVLNCFSFSFLFFQVGAGELGLKFVYLYLADPRKVLHFSKIKRLGEYPVLPYLKISV